MPTTKEQRDELLGKVSKIGEFTTRLMMGEYLLYRDGLLIGGFYDGQLLLKKVPATKSYRLPKIEPYPEAKKKLYLIKDLDNSEKLKEIIDLTYEGLKAKQAEKATAKTA